VPRLEKGSNISFHTRDFVKRLQAGWLPSQDDLTSYAANYQGDPSTAQSIDLVADPLTVTHVLAYTQPQESAFIPRMLDWAENMVSRQQQAAPPAIFTSKKPQSSQKTAERRPQQDIPADAAIAFNKANAAWRQGQIADALSHSKFAVQIAPAFVEAHILKARALRRLGENTQASDAYKAALAVDAANFAALLEHGNVLRDLGATDRASDSYAKAMEAHSTDPRPALALARHLEGQEGPQAAEQAQIAFQRAMDRAQESPDAGYAMAELARDMGRFRLERGDLPRALDALRHAALLSNSPDHKDQIDLERADVLLRLGMMPEARQLMERLSGSHDTALLRSLSRLAYRFNYWAEAIAILSRVATLTPDDPKTHMDLADMQVKSWRLEDALASLDRAAAFDVVPPAATAALRGSIANRLGDAQMALGIYEGLVSEGHDRFASNAAMSLLYADSVTPAEVARRHQALFADWGQDARAKESFDVDLSSDRPLRVGMVSGDLHHQHPVNIFMQPLLARWDHANLPLTIYNTGQTVDDQTRLARSRAGQWRDLSTAQLAERIAADRIDVLIDLAGHTAGGTLKAFAKRMAPVQVSFLGYPGSTGVPNIDWMIGDPIVTPPEADHLCSERVIRLPNTVFCFAPEVHDPLPDFAALAKSRPVTFGSFNNIPKLTPHTITLWAQILKAVPDARLLLRAPSFADAGAIARVKELFAKQEVSPERLTLRGPVALDVMMQAYREIDIALDPFPYCGGTTTLQALWMGVPVLTLKGGHFVSRMGASFMTAAGLPEWIADDDAGYVQKAAAFASDRTALVKMKAGLRERLQGQPAWNADQYAHDFTAALRHIWQETAT
jgi:predicted O-linked N-acetylglucosamine transferase (SPINDLY family)/plasmid stabilization system protein ParE